MTNKKKLHEAFITNLRNTLMPHYTPPNTVPGYDHNHVREMLVFGPKIKALTPYCALDLNEFYAAVWLHNTDRPNSLKEVIGFTKGMPDIQFKDVWASYLYKLLSESPFNDESRGRIVDAILQHSKKDDEPGDSLLLTCLRIADKVVRFGPLGMMGQPANNRGNIFYDPNKPFGYDSTEEHKLKSVYNDYLRVLEWYKMLHSDKARSLIKLRYLKIQIEYLRILGEQISEVTGWKNEVEADIAKALGPYYEQFK